MANKSGPRARFCYQCWIPEFRSAVLYGAETWTLWKRLSRKDGDQLDRSCEKWSITRSPGEEKYPTYTVWSKSFRTDFFKNRRHMRKRHKLFFLIQNKLHWHVYMPLCGRTVSEKLPKIPLFRPSLIHQLQLLGSQQHPQSGVLLTSFFNLGEQKIVWRR